MVSNTCVGCPAGTTNDISKNENGLGDDASGDGTSCDVTICGDNERVEDFKCVPCGPGRHKFYKDRIVKATAGTTGLCSRVICVKDHFVSSHMCMPCAPGTTRPAGDQAISPTDTVCVATRCKVDEHVVSNTCVGCPAGTTNDISKNENGLGDDASGDGTSCDVTICGATERVEDFKCVPCGPGRYKADIGTIVKATDGTTGLCTIMRECGAGVEEDAAPSQTSDRTCKACIVGSTFSDGNGSCTAVSTCGAGKGVKVAPDGFPTASADTQCEDCTDGVQSWNNVDDLSYCAAHTLCPAGKVEIVSAGNRECVPGTHVILWGFGISATPLDNQQVKVDDVVVFVWSGGHNVKKMNNPSCTSFSGPALGFSSPYSYTVTAEDAGTTLYFGCSYSNHCDQGVKASVTVASAASKASVTLVVPLDVDLASLDANDYAAVVAELLQVAATAGGFNAADVEKIVLMQNGAVISSSRRRLQRATNGPITAKVIFKEDANVDVNETGANMNSAIDAGTVSVSVNIGGKAISASVTETATSETAGVKPECSSRSRGARKQAGFCRLSA